MKKAFLYARIHRNDPINLGAVKKYYGLLKGFNQLGYDCDIVWYGGDGVFLNDEKICRFSLSVNSSAFRNIMFHHIWFDAAIERAVDFSQYDFMFVRYPLAHPGFLRLLKIAKYQNPDVRIFLEVPTYPYDLEFNSSLRNIQYWIDKQFQPFLKKYVDWTVHYGVFERLFGIPSIALRNGVDVGAIPVSRSLPKPDLLRLIAVGNWNYWHGLDRLIKGLGQYHNSEDKLKHVDLRIVGGGRAIPDLRKLVNQNDLEFVVRFYPPLMGEALDRLFDEADLAVGCLGMFRKGVALDSSLKHREYAARGVPFVTASNDPDFDKSANWVLQIPADETPVDLRNICAFYEKIKYKNIRLAIRQYALDRLDWKYRLRPLQAALK